MEDSKLQFLIEELHNAQKQKNLKNEIECLLELSQYHYNKSNFEKAELSLKNILQLDRGFANVHYYLALIEINKENYNKALQYLKQELKINPKNNYAKELKEKISIKANFPLITILLVLLNLGIFIYTFPQITLIESIKFGLSTYHLNLFNLFTSLFFHINWLHFTINTFILISFGLILEKNIGSLKFLTIYLISGIIGNFLEIFILKEGIVLGASAALFGILGALMMREPLMKVKLLGFINAPLIIVLGSFFLINFIITSFYDIGFISGDIAHFSGLLVGIFLIGLIYQETIDIFYNWLFIALGFWIIQYALSQLSVNPIMNFISIVYALIISIIGAYLVLYSYLKLKKISTIGGLQDE